MAVIVWIVEGIWSAAIDAARTRTPQDADIVLLHITDPDTADAAHGAYAGLLGRQRPERDPGTRMKNLAATSAEQLLRAAADRLGRPCTQIQRVGRPEEHVLAAAEGADLLIVTRDGDRSHLGPKSLTPPSRFVLDHAPCPILLLWPEPAPDRRRGPVDLPPG
ncbi:universal stress protein [Actinomadura rupiterrae]|uniref:universal stress protein n=1 Tax=Actinomadura rupiterrae TaxID=559627 RepID=UPI0020A5F55C|nr:universal stress protein [Actinomadura rupiterrae]MCP2342191.1 nucleotide-binding universal stress UspA family protein [Actinomadura rupiterrae]